MEHRGDADGEPVYDVRGPGDADGDYREGYRRAVRGDDDREKYGENTGQSEETGGRVSGKHEILMV